MRNPVGRMKQRQKLAISAGALLLVVAAAGIWSLSAAGTSQTTGPDVTVISITGTGNYGAVSGIRAFAVGTTSCNVGDQPVWWCNGNKGFCSDEQHPVIAQNLYRLKDGRFEQIGMSWLKHGFVSTNSFDSNCGSCAGSPHGGSQLGVGCTDTYGSSLNGSRPLGMRSEVNVQTGSFPYPYTSVATSTVVDQRMQVREDDLNPALNTGARYWAEGQYVTEDDALAGNGLNNASYREVTVSGPSFDLPAVGSTTREKAAIYVWPVVDPTVEIMAVDNTGASPIERFDVARKVTDLGGGVWHYEYAIHNMNSDRSARGFTVDFPSNTTITNVGFHGVAHHSGEPYATADWTSTVDTPTGRVTWQTEDFATNANANALRWGTMFSFWFDANSGPNTASHSIELFKPGSPTALFFTFGTLQLFADGFETGDTTAWTATVP
ncbi:MAG: hypothetical protein U0002_06590 [Thermoanaerobaculia bacterium]